MLGGVGEEQEIKTPLSTLENPSVGDRVGMRGARNQQSVILGTVTIDRDHLNSLFDYSCHGAWRMRTVGGHW